MTIKAAIKGAIVDPVTDKDGTPDVVRIAIALGVAVFLAMTIYTVVVKAVFDMTSFGIGFGSLLGGGGAGSMMHAKGQK